MSDSNHETMAISLETLVESEGSSEEDEERSQSDHAEDPFADEYMDLEMLEVDERIVQDALPAVEPFWDEPMVIANPGDMPNANESEHEVIAYPGNFLIFDNMGSDVSDDVNEHNIERGDDNRLQIGLKVKRRRGRGRVIGGRGQGRGRGQQGQRGGRGGVGIDVGTNEEDDEGFYQADDGRDEALLSGEAASFDWLPIETFQSTKEAFVPKQTGAVTPHFNMYDAFRTYWDDDILQHIVTETNRYASKIESKSFRSRWYPTNIHEIAVLFAFWLMLAIVKMPTIKSCFSSNPLLKTEIFRKMFTSRRYQNLCRALHFCNNDAKPPNASRLYLLGPILDNLNSKFQSKYVPSQNLSLDESLTLWKGQLLFKQYIASKVAKYGIKTFELCEASTGYLWSFLVYTGKSDAVEDNNSPSVLKSTSLVIKLMRPLLGKGYTVFMDNWFNSPTLARFLKRNKTDCVGTLRSTRREVPPEILLAQLRKGEFLARHAGDVSVMAWQDKRKICTISTYHGTEQGQVTTGKGKRTSTIHKPQLILDYNKNMGGVDRKDQMLEPYLLERKRHKKWYMKLFKRLLNSSILNSRILAESSTQSKIDHLTARLQLVHLILDNHLCLVPDSLSKKRSSNLSRTLQLDSLFAHWPIRISPTSSDNNRSYRLRCTVCLRKGLKNIKTIYKCKHCDVPLCVECFETFHV